MMDDEESGSTLFDQLKEASESIPGKPGDPGRDEKVGHTLANILEGVAVPTGKPKPCSLCGTMTECSPLGDDFAAANMPMVGNLDLCLSCMRRLLTDHDGFWRDLRKKFG